MKTLDEAIKHARDMAAGQLEEGKGDCAYEHEQLAGWLEELIADRKRISEMSEMLNNQHQAAQAQVEDERDACERAVQFLLDVADGSEPDTERTGSDDYIRALEQAVGTIQTRKTIQGKTIQEMAHGTMIGEFVQACVDDALEKDRARREMPSKDRPEDGEDQHPGWHGTLFIAEGNMASGAQLTKDADHLEDLAGTGYYDDTCDSGDVMRVMAAWLRRMAAR